MSQLGIIGGTGLAKLSKVAAISKHTITTPYGQPSAEIVEAEVAGETLYFLPRHGLQHNIAPDRINYRANLWALQSLGVTEVIAVAAVGGIRTDVAPETLVCPDQIIDYTYGREQSFFSDNFSAKHHIDFTYPYTEGLRQRLLASAKQLKIDMVENGVYGATQGPRLETAAEIARMTNDGCTLVGMTGMPEAALARELGMSYACCALVVNWAAGLSGKLINMSEIEQTLALGMTSVERVLIHFVEQKEKVK